MRNVQDRGIRGLFRHRYDEPVGKADDQTAFISNSPLIHAQVIRAGGSGHPCMAIFDFADVGVPDMDRLVFIQRIDTIFFSVYGYADGCGRSVFRNLHAAPQENCQKQNDSDENKLFLFQIMPHFSETAISVEFAVRQSCKHVGSLTLIISWSL